MLTSGLYYNNAVAKPIERVSIGTIHYPLVSWGWQKLVKQWSDPHLHQLAMLFHWKIWKSHRFS